MGGADGVGGLAKGSDNIEPYDNAGEYCDSQGNHSTSEQCNIFSATSDFNQYYNLKADQSGDFCKSLPKKPIFLPHRLIFKQSVLLSGHPIHRIRT